MSMSAWEVTGMRLSSGREVTVFALTGGIGSGKSLALEYFKSRGLPVFSADEIAKKVTRREGAAYSEILSLFGPEFCREDGELDYTKLGEVLFSDGKKLKTYMDILKPHIIRALELEIESTLTELKSSPDFVVLEAPVLFEYGMEKAFDYVILITCDEEERIRRIRERNSYTRAEALKRVHSQLSDEVKRRASHFEIVNTGTREEFEAKLALLYDEMEDLSQKRRADIR